jgi:hypothetical protein
MHNYAEHHGRLPPAAVCGEDGQPLLSWRVALLPYLGHEELYREFQLDEPWDGPHNSQLLSRMPSVYGLPRRKAGRVPPYHTLCHVFVGEGTPFEDGKALTFDADFPDGTCNTLLVVEAGEPVPWTKPQELRYERDGPLPDLRGVFKDGIRVRMADCSGRWVKRGTSEATLRALITRNGDDTPGQDW